jgi:hypothetical protein
MVLTPRRNLERVSGAVHTVAGWVSEICTGMEAVRNGPPMGGENQAEEAPTYENLLGVKYENSAGPNFPDIMDWPMPGSEGLP